MYKNLFNSYCTISTLFPRTSNIRKICCSAHKPFTKFRYSDSELLNPTSLPTFLKPLLSHQKDCDELSFNEQYCYLPINTLQRFYRKPPEIFPNFNVETVTNEQLNRLHALKPHYRPFITCAGHLAKEEAKLLLNAPMKELPAYGVHYHIKDYRQFAKGIPYTQGSLLHDNDIAISSHIIVSKMTTSGGIMLGTTSTPEFGFSCDTTNKISGTSRNPYNPELTVGGSSGGAASAIAMGIGQVGFANDGAGSIRIPACFCGVVGVKPSSNFMIHKDGNSWKLGTGTASAGTITRSVSDAAFVFDILTDSRHSFVKTIDTILSNTSPLANAKFAILPSFKYSKVEKPVAEVFVKAITKLQTSEPQLSLTTVDSLGYSVDPSDAASIIWEDVAKVVLRFAKSTGDTEQLLDFFSKRLWPFKDETEAGVEDAIQTRKLVAAAIDEFFLKYDFLITPTVATLPWPAGQGRPIPSSKRTDFTWNPFTYIFNWSNNPAVSIPCGSVSINGYDVPVGLQIVGKRTDDPSLDLCRVLEAAAVFEKVFKFFTTESRPAFSSLRYMGDKCCKTSKH